VDVDDRLAARARAAVGVLDVDPGATEAARQVGDGARLVRDRHRQHLRRHREYAPVAEQVEGVLGVAHDEPDDRMVDQVRDGERPDADAVGREVGREIGQDPGAVLEEHRELRDDLHHLFSVHSFVASGGSSALQGTTGAATLPPPRPDGIFGLARAWAEG
jgi:hypothetical protein